MKLLIAVIGLGVLQFGPRPPLAPAETLLEPAILSAIYEQAPLPQADDTVAGTDPAVDIVVSCAANQCAAARRAVRRLSALVAAKTIPPPIRSLRVSSTLEPGGIERTTSVIHVAEVSDGAPRILRGLWSTAGVGDEVAEIIGRHLMPGIEVRPYEPAGQLTFDAYGIPSTTIVTNSSLSNDTPAAIVAATAYFLATLPNAGAEALLSHLTVGAHARLAEDGRRAVALMGNQQRASAEVLIMFGQAIEREQRRMRSFERFVPAPVDPLLRSRLADMEQGITSVWTSMGITSSPFVPPAQRIRGRGGEDRRIVAKAKPGPLPSIEPPTAFLKFQRPEVVAYELHNFIDGRRSISDIRDAVSAEFGPLPLPSVVDFFERLAHTGAISLK